ncbi:MAG: serine O-acetyltransferase, partial [Cyanobacteriota bacterium]|nr:serine O-acetyltransferase [Cyanobacteriota bacterium]
ADVIRNLMDRIDQLETLVTALHSCLQELSTDRVPQDLQTGQAQNLKDREIIEFLGDTPRS